MAPSVRIKRPKKPEFLKRFSITFSETQSKVIWVMAMVFLGTADMLVQWWNWYRFTKADLERGLVIGAPPALLVYLMLAFTMVGTILYIPETLNTLSVFKYDGDTRFPIVIEQVIVQALEAIPLGAVNYFISHCRCFTGSIGQTAWGSLTIIFTFTRLIWYAHLEGRKFVHKASDEVQMKKGYFMLLCALFASAMAFPVMIWRTAADFGKFPDVLAPVSIVLVKAPFLEHEQIKNYRIDGILEQFNYDTTEPYLIKSVADIFNSYPGAFTATFKCDTNATFSPPECLLPQGHLVFNFTYANKKERKPLGEILYNYAYVPQNAAAAGKSPDSSHKPSNRPEYKFADTTGENSITDCNAFDHDLSGGWRLAYYKITPTNEDGARQKGDPVYASSPWIGCTTPKPWFKSDISNIC